jgi:Cu(I)/Ag(I) efflux system membrane fusion protein
VLKGLKAGEEVVTSAQFLIDSESKLREATEKMVEPQPVKGAHSHD